MKKMVWQRKINSGFSLIEILIAIFLIGVAFVGVVAFFNSSLQSHFDAQSELIAAGLAQEGSELIRNLRDYHSLNDDTPWSDLKSDLPSCTRIDYRSLTTHVCDNSLEEDVCLDADGRYKQCEVAGTGVGMKRSIEITLENDGEVEYLNVLSKVTWNDRTTEATDRLYENEY